jgi:hypothetical protein
MLRPDREDYSAQQERVAEARRTLSVQLRALIAEAKNADRIVLNGRGDPTMILGTLYAHVDSVRRCEEALDLALLDLRTAQGEDA